MKPVLGQNIPSLGVTGAVCFRWPFALGVDWSVMPTWGEKSRLGRAVSLALIFGPVEVSLSVFWS